MGRYSAMAVAENLFWNLKLIPTEIEVAYKSHRAWKDPSYIEKLKAKREKKTAKKTAKEQKAHDEEIMKQAKEAAQADRKESYTQSIDEYIAESVEPEDMITRVALITKATETNKLIQFAFFYMTDSRGELIEKPQIEREIINGIAALFNFGRIYPENGVSALKMYDPSFDQDYCKSSKYLLSISDILAKSKDPLFMEKLAKRKEELEMLELNKSSVEDEGETKSTWAVDNNGIIHPVFVKDEPVPFVEKSVQGEGISDELFAKLEATFCPLISAKHRYELAGNMINLYITREDYGIEELYTVDPGIVMGAGKICVLSNIGNDTIFVSTDHVDIMKKVLSTAFYVLEPAEVQTVMNDYFRNMTIYRYMDMSDTEFLNGLDKKDFHKLGKKLTYILNQLAKNGAGTDLPRFRFNYWNGIDDFIIISDPTVKSPIDETSKVICEGLMFEVKGDDITQRYKTDVVEYHIDKYGEM